MIMTDKRPAVWVGHVGLYTERVSDSCKFMEQIGMRRIMCNDDFALLELRGGTHLGLTTDKNSSLLSGTFDLMVDDLDATHSHFKEIGLEPGDIERGSIHDSFEMTEPGGNTILFNSSHVGDLPV